MKKIIKETSPSVMVGKPEEDVLKDIDCVLQSKYTPKKRKSEHLSVIYRDMGLDTRAKRVFDCGEYLEFASPILEDGSLGSARLFRANFCRDRYCPMCSWRKSLKLFGQVSSVMNQLQDDYKFIFLTLTVVNCDGPGLKNLIDKMFHAVDVFFKRREVSHVVKGYFRTLEITRNRKNGTFHPHIHLILAVDKEYGSVGHDYIDQKTWLKYWRESMGDNRINQLNVQLLKADAIKDKKTEITYQKAIAEISKYSVKGNDFIIEKNHKLSKEILGYLMPALYHRKLFHFAGCFRKVFKELKLQDIESKNVDLSDIESINPTIAYVLIRYEWSCGIYKTASSKVVEPGFFDTRAKALKEKHFEVNHEN